MMDLSVSRHDRDILRALVREQAEIASLPIHDRKAELWQRLNDLDPARPMVWINEIPWHEMDVDGELTLQSEGGWAREIETRLRRQLYQWRHMPGDMVVDGYVPCPLSIQSTGFGLSEDVDIVRTDEANSVVSRRFHRQIVEPSDIDRIEAPHIAYDAEASERAFSLMQDAFGDILPVRQVGIKGSWFAPWDELIRWWGVEEALTDMVLRPQFVNEVMSTLVDAYIAMLDQWESLGLLARNDDDTRIGSGGYGYTSELPREMYDPHHVCATDLWGSAAAQIFSAVSPEMHWEFALRHELRWLRRWGLTYYGCCEPLDQKLAILRRIPNLRKVSMSRWVDMERAAREVGRDYVFSYKPNPALLAEERFRPQLVRQELEELRAKAGDCCVEIIMKDISTVCYEPQRLWEWERIAREVVETWG
jgi:hypothetical protein